MPVIFIPLGSGVTAVTVGTLATIPIGGTTSHYRRIALWPTPSAVITYAVDYERDILDMANSTDEPSLPFRFHRLVGVGARMKEYEKREDWKRYQLAKQDLEHGCRDLRYFLQSGNDVRPVMGRRVIQRPSQLGGWYEAGT